MRLRAPEVRAKLVALLTVSLLAVTAVSISSASADARPIAATDNITVMANEALSVDFCANDVPGDGALSVAYATNPPPGLTRSGCVLSGSTTRCDDTLIWYFVRDNDGDGSWGRINLFVDCSNIDRVPDPKTDILRNFFRNQPATFDLCTNDDMGDQPATVTFNSALPDGLIRDGCLITGVPTICASASNFFYVVEDADGDRGRTHSTIQVRCTPKPEPDAFSLAEGDSFSADLCANDYLADEPTTTAYSVALPAGMSVSDCMLEGTPTECGEFTSFYWIRDRDRDRSSTEINLDIECAVRPTTSVLYFDDFESAESLPEATNWTVNPNGTDTGGFGVWQRANPTQAVTTSGVVTQLGTVPSGDTAWVTGRRAGVSAETYDLDSGSTTVRSALIDVPLVENPTLEFDWYFAHASNANTSDKFTVTISGPGLSLTTLNVTGRGEDVPAQWRHHAVDLTPFAGEQIIITVTATDAGPESTIEAAFDNVAIRQVPVALTAPGATAFNATSSVYKLAATTYPDVRSDLQTELWATVHRPTDMSQGPYPLVMLMHGNHLTCGTGPFPRSDNNNQYATTGTCPLGTHRSRTKRDSTTSPSRWPKPDTSSCRSTPTAASTDSPAWSVTTGSFLPAAASF